LDRDRTASTILIQDAGGLARALIQLGKAGWHAGLGNQAQRTRTDPTGEQLGADAAFEPGARLPARVDAVIESVGKATW
jgi:hypothetical protein